MVLTFSKYSKTFFFLFYLYATFCHRSFSFKLSDSKILLSYNKGLPSNYTLKVTGSESCFEWKSSNPHIVSVTPILPESNCSKSAVLSCVANLLKKEVTHIKVTERTTGKTIICEVYTDTVDSIEFEYVADELFVGGSPERISVIAKDKEGRHRFTSINGLEIKWQVKNFDETGENEVIGSDVIKLTKFDISEYEAPTGNELENRGLLSSNVLAKPLEPGTALITATVLFHGKSVLTKDLKLNVLPNWINEFSSPLYLVRHGKVNVTLKNQGENFDFATNIEDPTVVTFKENSRELYAKEYGYTSIKIHNENIKTELVVHVVKVKSIGFRISNGGYTTLEELKLYEFFIDLFDEEGNIIHPSDNLRLDVKFPPKLFHVIYTTKNGTYFIVQTTAPGRSKVKAEFKGVLLEDDSIAKENEPISATILVSVRQKLSIFPPYTLLPVLKQKPMHKITLKVSGGTGNYVWSLNNYEVAKIVSTPEINNTIQLEVYDEIYDLIVTVADLSNINFITKAWVSCQTPLDLEVYPSVVEAEVNNYVIVPVALLGYEDKSKDVIRKFDDCSMVNEIDVVDPYVITYEKEADIPAFGKGCKSLSFKCKAPGHSRINIEYTLDESKNITFKTTTVLACFKPLKPVYPVRVAVLALGTSMDVAFEGGPRRWPLFKGGHFPEMLASNPELVKIELIKDPMRYNKDLTVFRVKCLALGENTLTFKIRNEKSATLPHPASSESSIKVICSEPKSLHLKLFKKQSKKTLAENIVKVPFYGEKMFEVDIYAKDHLGRVLKNLTSLRIAWDVDDKTLASPVNAFDFESYENAVSGYRKLSRNFMKFRMTGGTGDLKVEAKVTSYRTDVLEKERISNYKELETEISTAINLKLVSLRDINNDLYDAANEKVDTEGYCEGDSCKS